MPDTEHVKTIEQGNIFFFYRPKVQEEHPDEKSDIQRFYMILSPNQKQLYRLTVIGQKELPQPGKSGHRKYWGYTEMVSEKPEEILNVLGPEHYHTKTRGERTVGAARPAGEGVYRIVNHDGHTHLVYMLELPRKTGDVQNELNIDDQASYVITVKNPATASPPKAGLPKKSTADYPQKLQEKFGERRFSEVDPTDFLDFSGAEFILIAASDDIKKDLGIELDTNNESICSASIFTDLKIDISTRPTKPLFKGEWQ
jgi:hypothetical protein